MKRSNWFLIPNFKDNPALKLICFSYAGGSAATYLSWDKWLPNNVELIAVQLPGRASRMLETGYSDMDNLVNDLILEIEDLVTTPYVLFGHSLGSRIAFELMSKLTKSGLPQPQHFIASGSRDPSAPCQKNIIHNLSTEAFILELKRLNGTPKEILDNKELMELCIPTLRTDFKLAETYYYSSNAVFDCSISVLGGTDDTDITFENLQNWGSFFSSPISIHMIPGDHFFIESNKTLVLEVVNQVIQKELSNLQREKAVL